VRKGARQEAACEILGLSSRTVQRWRAQSGGEDRRKGPKQKPANALTEEEEQELLDLMNAPRFRGLPPTQIVPLLADEGIYLASESTCYRLLRANDQLPEATPNPSRVRRAKPRHVATRPNQLWCWDITYLRCQVRGQYLYLYVFMDVWSRKIVGWEVYASERAIYSASLLEGITAGMEIEDLILHADNGGPMKGAPMLHALSGRGITASFSRARVSNDNPFIESLFNTFKSRPGFPVKPFESLEEARACVERFVHWYNNEHLHSGIGYVTPAERHAGEAEAILERRSLVYAKAKERHPNRWTRSTRSWKAPAAVYLNPENVADRHGAAKPTDPPPLNDSCRQWHTSAGRSPATYGTQPSGR